MIRAIGEVLPMENSLYPSFKVQEEDNITLFVK